jgi:hypothetical protein
VASGEWSTSVALLPFARKDATVTTSVPVQYSTEPPTIFGREPALLLGAASAAIALGSALFLNLDAAQQSVLNAAVAAIVGLVVALKVQGGTWAAALLALLQTLIALALGFNFDLSPEIQSGIMLLATTVLSFATRGVVVADPPAAPGSARTA